jgi:hypothetical protein
MPLVRISTVEGSQDGRTLETSPGMMTMASNDVSPHGVHDFGTMDPSNPSKVFDFDDPADAPTDMSMAPADDWNGAFDDTRPEYGSMQSSLDIAIPL